jgi:hypothetical protein
MQYSGQSHTLRLLYPQAGRSITYYIGGRVGPKVGVDILSKRTIYCFFWEGKRFSDLQSVKLTAVGYTQSVIRPG